MAADNPLAVLSSAERERLEKESRPRFSEPMLATLTEDRFSSGEWIYERKFDGIRCLASRDDNGVALSSRNHKPLNDSYPELVEALSKQDAKDFVIDGEIVAFRGKRTSFSRLQGRSGLHDPEAARATGIAVYYYVFDVLYLDGWRLARVPLRARKRLLKRALTFDDPLRYTQHRNEAGERFYRAACGKGWEGVIAKRADSRYRSSRSKDWLKFKCVHQQEFIIGGFTEPRGSRTGFGALLLGYYAGRQLRYAGMVGTGFDHAQLDRLHAKLVHLERQSSPFAGNQTPRSGVHWVAPRLISEVGFTEWTDEAKLRHPRFLGLRDDKTPRDVVREAA
jgi:DNA ligase D-like protein (predicted ligase)